MSSLAKLPTLSGVPKRAASPSITSFPDNASPTKLLTKETLSAPTPVKLRCEALNRSPHAQSTPRCPRDANQRSPHAGQRPPSGSGPCALTAVYLYCDTVARLPPRARVPPPRFGVDPLVNLPRGWVLQHVLAQRQAPPPPCRACAGTTVPTCPASSMYCRCSNTSASRTTSSMGGIPR